MRNISGWSRIDIGGEYKVPAFRREHTVRNRCATQNERKPICARTAATFAAPRGVVRKASRMSSVKSPLHREARPRACIALAVMTPPVN